MTTYAIMKSRIADELVNEEISTSQIGYAIADSIKQYETRPYWFNCKIATFSTVNAQEYYGAADLSDIPDILYLINALVTVNGVKRQLLPYDFNAIDDNQPGIVVGWPTSYAYFDQKIRLYPIPNDTYTITLSYVYSLPDLSADDDTNAWTTYAEEVIRQSAKRRLAMDVLHAEDLAARCEVMEQDAYKNLLSANARKMPMHELYTPPMLVRNKFNIYRGW